MMANYFPNSVPAKQLLPLIAEDKLSQRVRTRFPFPPVDPESIFCCTMQVYGRLYMKALSY
jgi:hypothetical protein